MEQEVKKEKNKITLLDEKLGEQRDKWSRKITALANGIKTLSGMEVVIGDILQTRQLLVEQLMYIQIKSKEQKKQLDLKWRDAWIKYYQYDYKLTDKVRTQFLEAELADDKMILSLLENQVEFYRESVKTLDNMGFAVRNRLAIKDLV
tara:strand:- start:6148 stop:6591 length:444 start_codon:yes stop_codon:yes gene_type:complete